MQNYGVPADLTAFLLINVEKISKGITTEVQGFYENKCFLYTCKIVFVGATVAAHGMSKNHNR